MMKCALASRAAHTLENWPSSTTRYKTEQPTHTPTQDLALTTLDALVICDCSLVPPPLRLSHHRAAWPWIALPLCVSWAQ